MVAGRGGARRTVAIALALVAAAVTAPSGASAAPGEVYASDFDQHAVWKLPAAGGNSAVKITATGIGETAGMAIGPDGRIYVGAQTGRVWRIDTATASIALFAELGAGRIAEDVAFDAQGRLLVLDRGQNDVLAVDRVTKAVTPVFDGPGTTDFGSLAAMRNGDLFITTQSGDDLLRLSGGVLTPVIENTIDFPDALTLSADERYLFFISRNDNRVYRRDLASGELAEIDPGFEPRGLALLPSGRLVVTAQAMIYTTPFASSGSTLFSAAPGLVFPSEVVVEPARCGGLTPTVVGTDARDVIRGSAFADVISSLGGKDVVSGLGGNDVVCGGASKDVLRGGAGRDRLLGQAGRDKLIGGKGKDKLKGGAGRDVQRQ
ncbi:MAG: hypothetical protein ACXWGV_03780 [Solirubrobacterales bacterium]